MRRLTFKRLLFFTLFSFFLSLKGYSQGEGTIKIESSQSIKQLINQKRNYNKNKKYLKGYKVQLFYGSEQGALKIRNEFSTVFPDVKSELKFHSPYWKVWVGAYKTRLEADKGLQEIKDGFPSAIVVPAMIRIKHNL